MAPTPAQPCRIGIGMAGAIAAGACSASVLHFLTQALESKVAVA